MFASEFERGLAVIEGDTRTTGRNRGEFPGGGAMALGAVGSELVEVNGGLGMT